VGGTEGDICQKLARNQRAAGSFDGAFQVTLAAGIASVAFAAGWYVLAPKAPSIAPVVGKDTAGAAITGSF
jgi:hypothetical protein